MDLYHYTDRITGAEIQADGVIRAQHLRLHRDMLARDEGVVTERIVWLTTATPWDETVAKKLAAAGWPYPPQGQLWRFVIDQSDITAYTLDEYMDVAAASGIDPEWWEWVVRTGELAASDPRDWRIVPGDIPGEKWERVQQLTDGGYWLPVP